MLVSKELQNIIDDKKLLHDLFKKFFSDDGKLILAYFFYKSGIFQQLNPLSADECLVANGKKSFLLDIMEILKADIFDVAVEPEPIDHILDRIL